MLLIGFQKGTFKSQICPFLRQICLSKVLCPRGGKVACKIPIVASKSPVLPFLDFSFFTKEKPQIYQGFSLTAEPKNPWKRPRKYQNNQGNSDLRICQGNPKNQGKEGQGRPLLQKNPLNWTGSLLPFLIFDYQESLVAPSTG